MTQLQQCIRAVQRRQQMAWLWKCLATGTAIGGAVGTAIGLVRLMMPEAFGWEWVIAPVVLGMSGGLLLGLLRRQSLKIAALTIDHACQLKDRTQTALQFLQSEDLSIDPLRKLQIEDAEAHAATIDPQRVAPISGPRFWPAAVALLGISVLLAIFSTPRVELQAAEPSSEVVSQQAERIEDELEELKQLQKEEQDPELEQLVKDLQAMIEQLKEPGVDPREALAKISEMEASLQQMQQQLSDPAAAAELQQVGDALTLSEDMAMAGDALSKGELDKAAEQLEALEMPELDRKTEKAVTEKLEQLSQGNENGQPKSTTQDAASQISQGLTQGNRGKFQDGMKSLAGEARRQSRRSKLSDLLKKQCQCMSECKGECESECRNQAMSNKKGGTKAGSAASGNQPGDKTAKLKTNPEMNITGQESATGDAEIETLAGDEQQQEAVRAYREKAADYEALSESVLETENIPLGHRQTIRKYFEMIRPSDQQTDAVNEQTDQTP